MIKVRFVCVGKLKEEYLRAGCAEYEKRLLRFCRPETVEVAEKPTLREEGEDILRALRGHVVVLTPEGERLTSEEFAADIRKVVDRGEELTFVIGSSNGLSAAVKAAANERVSFSAMTMPHQLFRLVLFEQVYRAFTILGGVKYHK